MIELLPSSNAVDQKLCKLALAYLEKINTGSNKDTKLCKEEILALCKNTRINIGTSRDHLISVLRRAGIDDINILNQIKDIDTYIIQEPRLRQRPFNLNDAKFVTEAMIQHPDTHLYNTITNKVRQDEDTEEVIQSNYRVLVNQLDDFVGRLGSNFKDFKGGGWYSNSNQNLHQFSNPRELQIEKWWCYTMQTKNLDGKFKRENTSTRVYLHPNLNNWFRCWYEILTLLEKNNLIIENGFQSKVPNFFNCDKLEFPLLKNQSDRILFYFGENTQAEALKIIQDYVNCNPSFFEATHSLATPLLDKEGNQLSCAFTTDGNLNYGQSFNQLHTNILQDLINKFLLKYTKDNGTIPTTADLAKKLLAKPDFKLKFEDYLVENYSTEAEKNGFRPDNIAFLKK